MQQIDTVINGFVGDYYNLNNQRVFIVKNNLKTGHAEILMTGTFTYSSTGTGDNAGNKVTVVCEGDPSNCADYGTFIREITK